MNIEVYSDDDVVARKAAGIIAGCCCARAASGHAAALPSSVMNSRRFIRLARRRGRFAARSKGRTCPAYAMQCYLS